MYNLNEKQIEIVNNWLEEAYNQGYKAGAASQNVAEPPASNEKVYPITNCIPDLSSYDKTIDFDTLCANVDFVTLRTRYCNKTDNFFEDRARELVVRDMPFAVYDYATLMSHDNAKLQAEKLYELASPYNPRIYYIDTEQLGTGVSRTQEYEYIRTYVKRLRELGAKVVGQYTGDWLYSTYYYKLQDIFDTIWIASYGKNNGLDEGITLKSAAKCDKVDLHQYTDKGTIPGVSNKGDLSHLTGNKPLEWFTGRKYE